MGAIKDKMLQWMDEMGLTEEDLEAMDNVNAEFGIWLQKKEQDAKD